MEKACFIKSNNGGNDVQTAYIIKKGKTFDEKCGTSEFAFTNNVTWEDCSIAYDEKKNEFIWFIYHNGTKTKHENEWFNYPYMSESVQDVITNNSAGSMLRLSKSEIRAEICGKTVKTFEIPKHVMPQKKRKRETEVEADNEKKCSCPLMLLKIRVSKHCHDIQNFVRENAKVQGYGPSEFSHIQKMIPLNGPLFDYISYYVRKKFRERGVKRTKELPLVDQLPADARDIVFHLVEKMQDESWENFHNKLTGILKKKWNAGDRTSVAKFESFVKTCMHLYGDYIF